RRRRRARLLADQDDEALQVPRDRDLHPRDLRARSRLRRHLRAPAVAHPVKNRVIALCLLLAACGGGGGESKSLAQGKALLAEGKYEAAVAELSKATAEDRNSMDAWLNLGHAYRGTKRYDNALAAYVAAKKIDRHSIAPHLAHAKVQIELGNVELATTELNFVVEMDPKNLEGEPRARGAQPPGREHACAAERRGQGRARGRSREACRGRQEMTCKR